MKRILTAIIALVLVFSFSVEAFGFSMEEVGSKYDITYNKGSGKGTSKTSEMVPIGTATTLISGSGFTKSGYVFAGWEINGKAYAAGASFPGDITGAYLGSDSQYHFVAYAIYTKDGSIPGVSTPSTSTPEGKFTVTYDPGTGKGTAQTYTYNKGEHFVLPNCPFTKENAKFDGWEYGGKTYEPGTEIAADFNVTFTAQWKNSGVTVVDPNSSEESGSSSSSKTSSSSSSKTSSSSSSKTSSSSSSKTSSSSSSSSSSSVPESSSSVPESSSSIPESSNSSSVVETPSEEKVTLGYSIAGDIPVTKIEFALDGNIGENPQLAIVALDSYSVTDPAAAKFIKSGDALAAFDISMLVDGLAYTGPVSGELTYQLNGTQASWASNYDAYVLAMVHTVNRSEYHKEYYLSEGKTTYLYDPFADFKSEAGNVTLVDEDGVYRLVIRDVEGLSNFAYLANANTIVEVSLIPSASAEKASIRVNSFSPFLLAQIEVGSGKAASAGIEIPFWVWIVIAVVVIVIGAIVVFIVAVVVLSKNKKQPVRRAPVQQQNISAGITGFDDDDE